ncbi:hypothetical protein XHC_0828 [Xanthomonas hortorum pv. carotae str. M081]|nr:hypothetical protein XHC_0828 [Xanthomonas hortorum pv. carotae str. M081]
MRRAAADRSWHQQAARAHSMCYTRGSARTASATTAKLAA